MSAARVLLVWASPDSAHAVAALQAAGFDTWCVLGSLEGLIVVEEWLPNLVVLHWRLPFIDGAIFLSAIAAGLETPPPVVALVTPGQEAEARAAGAAAVLTVPVSVGRLVDLVGELQARTL